MSGANSPSTYPRRLFVDLHRRLRRDEFEQLENVPVAHPNAADRTGLAEFRAVWRAVDVDEATHRIDIAEAVASGFAPGKPKNPRQDPVSARMLVGKLARKDFPGRSPPDEDGVFWLTGTDPGTHDVAAAWRAVAAALLSGAHLGC